MSGILEFSVSTYVFLAVKTLGNFLAFNFAPPHPDLYVNPSKICSFIAIVAHIALICVID